MPAPLIEIQELYQDYTNKALKVSALQGISFTIDPGEQVAITGPSGCGKTTLLNILGLLDLPSRGHYTFNGTPTHTLDDASLSTLRGQSIGFVFQSYNLIERLTLAENVALPLLYGAHATREPAPMERALECLKRVGLKNRASHRPSEVSGGQQQRTAIARALIQKPRLILADEPTGALDSKSSDDILALLKECNQELGTTLVIITHDKELAKAFPRQIQMSDGRITLDTHA